MQRLSKKFGYTVLGLFFLGILFFFVKGPCAFPLFNFWLASVELGGTLFDLSLFLLFIVGLLVPFIGIGIIGGGTPKLARKLREKYRSQIRALSGY